MKESYSVPEDAPQEQTGEQKAMVRVPDGTPTIYTNAMHVTATIYDITLVLGQLRSVTEEGVEVDWLARVAMSPQHAVSLSRLLNERLAWYEGRYGRIPVPLEEDEATEDDLASAPEPPA